MTKYHNIHIEISKLVIRINYKNVKHLQLVGTLGIEFN